VLRPHYFWAALLTCLLVPATSQAGFVITGSAGNGFQNLSGYTLNENGSPFFDNHSLDGSQQNIGYFLTKTGGFSSSSKSPAIPQSQLGFWGTASGGFDTKESFSSGGSNVAATFVLTVAGNSGSNIIGYRDASGDHDLIVGNIPPGGLTETFTPNGNFAFYLKNKSFGYRFYSDNTIPGDTDPTQQHFAVFQQSGSDKLWLGVEDLPGNNHGEGYGDFNDMIFSIQLVPEPGGLTVFGVGVLSLAGYGWRRRKQLPPLAAA
jgi:hypothetical protein